LSRRPAAIPAAPPPTITTSVSLLATRVLRRSVGNGELGFDRAAYNGSRFARGHDSLNSLDRPWRMRAPLAG
jgi:hypothetical protein